MSQRITLDQTRADHAVNGGYGHEPQPQPHPTPTPEQDPTPKGGQ